MVSGYLYKRFYINNDNKAFALLKNRVPNVSLFTMLKGRKFYCGKLTRRSTPRSDFRVVGNGTVMERKKVRTVSKMFPTSPRSDLP